MKLILFLVLVVQFISSVARSEEPRCTVDYKNEPLVEVSCEFTGPRIEVLKLTASGKDKAAVVLGDWQETATMTVVLEPAQTDVFELLVYKNGAYSSLRSYLPFYHGDKYVSVRVTYHIN